MFSIDAIKALAIVLVTNSHLSAFYPTQAMATGGLLGNALFFFCSGYAITLSLQKRPDSFLPWYLRRLKRIYFQLWIVSAILLLTGTISITGFASLIETVLAPDRYWFLPAIAALYPACYLLIRQNSRRANLGAFAAACLLYAILYFSTVDFHKWDAENHVVLKSTFYFAVMVASIHFAQHVADRPSRSSGGIALLTSTLGFFGLLAVLKITERYEFQFGAQIVAMLWTLCIFRTFRYPPFEIWLSAHLRNVIRLLSSLTLQIYLVQVPVVEYFRVEKLPFPINLVIFAMVVLGLAWLLNKVSNFLFDRLAGAFPYTAKAPRRS